MRVPFAALSPSSWQVEIVAVIVNDVVRILQKMSRQDRHDRFSRLNHFVFDQFLDAGHGRG